MALVAGYGRDAVHEFRPGAAWRTAAILALAYVFSYVDRQLLALLVVPVRQTLAITDTQISLLTGAAFGICYSVTAIPLGRIADHGNRRNLAAAGFATWSAMTLFCGFAHSFGELLVGRMGVAIGEAALVPAAYSLLADLFPTKRLTLAMGIFVIGAPVGTAGAYLAGGALIGILDGLPPVKVGGLLLHSWQLCFIIIGLAGLVTSAIMLAVYEPRLRPPPRTPHLAQPSSGLRFILGSPGLFAPLMMAIALANIFLYGVMAWIPTYFVRAHGLSVQEAGLRIGFCILCAGAPAPLAGGWASSRLLAAGVASACLDAYALGALICLVGVVGMTVSTGLGAAYCGVVLVIFGYFFMAGAFPPLIQLMTAPASRAQVAAWLLLAANLAGLGLGPTVFALVTDYVFGSDESIGSSILLVSSLLLPPALGLMLLTRGRYARAVEAIAAGQ